MHKAKSLPSVRTKGAAIGADHVIDYTKEDFARNGQQFDLILAANGDPSISDYWRALTPKDVYVQTGGSMAQMTQAMLQGPWISMTGSQKMGNMGVAKPNQNDLVIMKELLEAGKVKPVIDRCYPLSEVPDAIRILKKDTPREKLLLPWSKMANYALFSSGRYVQRAKSCRRGRKVCSSCYQNNTRVV